MTALMSPVAAWAAGHREELVIAGLAVSVLLLGLVVRRAVRGGRPDRWIDAVAFATAFAWSAEGMFEVATQDLKLPILFAWVVFFLFEAQMLSSMLRANRHQREHGHPGRHGRAVWMIAAVAGVVVAAAADSPVEVPLRFVVPLLAAHQWWLGLTADGITRDQGAVSWRWTPRRFLLWAGAIEPGERDIVQVDRERRIAEMTAVAHRLHHGRERLRGWRAGRLRRLALEADDAMIAEVRARISRVNQVQALTAPQAVAPVQVAAEPDVAAAPPVITVATEVATIAATARPPNAVAVANLTATATAKSRPSGGQDTATKVAKLVAKDPAIDAATVANRLAVSQRTARRYLATAKPASGRPERQINGHVPDLEVTR